jgi:Uma2 family endonuclease
MPDDGWRYEVVEGVLVRVAGSGLRATTIARRLAARLGDFVDEHGLGFVTSADGVYRFPGAETGLLPDVGYLKASRRALIPDLDKPIPVPPDLAVEIASPSQSRAETAAEAQLYLKFGTALVWVIWPRQQRVDVRHAGDRRPSRILGITDALDGEDVVPGFFCPIAPLFRV